MSDEFLGNGEACNIDGIAIDLAGPTRTCTCHSLIDAVILCECA